MLIEINDGILTTPDNKQLLSHIAFRIDSGDLVHVYGPNGCGKSSLFKAILGIESVKVSKLSKKNFSYFYLPQMENKEFLLPLQLIDISKNSELVGEEKSFLRWNLASGGERKKTLISRAMEADCDLYLLDEPYNHLDSESIVKVNSKISKLIERKKTVIIIGHQKPIFQNEMTVKELDIAKWS